MEAQSNNGRERRFGFWRGMRLGTAVLAATLAWTLRTQADDSTPTAAPAAGATAEQPDQAVSLNLMPGQSHKLTVLRKIKRANVLNPDIADVVALGTNDLLVSGKKTGSTQVVIWDENDQTQVVDIHVGSAIDLLRTQLHALFPDSKIEADEAGGMITLHGRVTSLQLADQANQVASQYGKVVNLLEVAGGQQVMLRVRFAEVNKVATSKLGVNLGFTDGKSFLGDNMGQINPFGTSEITSGGNSVGQVLASPSPGAAVTLFGQGMVGATAFQYFVDALRENDLLRILAEPDLVAISGEEASFQAGGQYPIPVVQSGNSGGSSSISIEYKDYGVLLHFTPIVLGNGNIRLKVAPEVSDLDYSAAVTINGFVVPGLNTRKVQTTVELAAGQTFAIAGLLQNNTTANNLEFPGLGDLPVIGALFRSVQYQRNETELVVLVTPVLVHGVDPADVSALPGEHWRDPSELDLFAMKDMGGEATDAGKGPQAAPAQFQGEYGFQPPAPAAK